LNEEELKRFKTVWASLTRPYRRHSKASPEILRKPWGKVLGEWFKSHSHSRRLAPSFFLTVPFSLWRKAKFKPPKARMPPN